MTDEETTLVRLEGFDLPVWGGAYQCSVCRGIAYTGSADVPCPYCNEEEDE